MIPSGSTLAASPYLETTVRFQSECGHVPITSGRCRCLRDPMYAGVILRSLAARLIYGSAWAFVLAAAIAVLFIIRTALETARRATTARLCRVCPYRLLPALWWHVF
jgi:protein-S-isoprenylcysteine O-methyltransferase Ste14